MTNLKIHIHTPNGNCHSIVELPKCLVSAVGEMKVREALVDVFESLGAEVTSIQRVEEISYEL